MMGYLMNNKWARGFFAFLLAGVLALAMAQAYAFAGEEEALLPEGDAVPEDGEEALLPEGDALPEDGEGSLPPENAAGGFVYMAVDINTLGDGFLYEPMKIPFDIGENYAALINRFLGPGKYANAGSADEGFYITEVSLPRSILVNVPEIIAEKNEEPIKPGDTLEGGSLREKDFCNTSAWMVTVNNRMATEDMSVLHPEGGDVFRLQFSVCGNGADLGLPADWEGAVEPFYEGADKGELIKAVAEINAAPYFVELFDNLDVCSAYYDAYAALANLTAAQSEVDGALGALEEVLKAFGPDPAAAEGWIVVDAPGGEIMTGVQGVLESGYSQTAGPYDYSEVKKLKVTGEVAPADFTAIKANFAATLTELDLSEIEASSYPVSALNGMAVLENVILGDITPSNLMFRNCTALETVTFGAVTSLGAESAQVFCGCENLKVFTFQGETAPAIRSAAFSNSCNEKAGARTVTARAPDKTAGGYENLLFKQYFADVEDIADAPGAGPDAADAGAGPGEAGEAEGQDTGSGEAGAETGEPGDSGTDGTDGTDGAEAGAPAAVPAETGVSKDAVAGAAQIAALLEPSAYTAESWKGLVAALADAIMMLAKEGVTQDEIDAAYNAVMGAVASLERAA
ncbi:MAG: leucine-rich repeat domain-containing protein [Clostridiales bacterium]|nr:leucine-rich repeat domain-containing protein [Clostridiales bacterium]